MATTEFLTGNALTQHKWSVSLAKEAQDRMYFDKFMSAKMDSIIVVLTELAKGKGDKITFPLLMKLVGYGMVGDGIIEGDATAEEALATFSDYLFIDQIRKSVVSAGKMSEQRVDLNKAIRLVARDQLAIWGAEFIDRMIMYYLAGARGMGGNELIPYAWTGFAGNALQAPDAGHYSVAGTATGKADMTTANSIMTLADINKLVAKAELATPAMTPVVVEGEQKFVFLMHTLQEYQLRISTTENDWSQIQLAAGVRGDGNKIFKNALGEYAGVVLHSNKNVVTFDDYGTGGDVTAARALFLGAQAGVVAFGNGTGVNSRFSWNEMPDDRGNQTAVTIGTIMGAKKTVFNSKAFGVMAHDSYVPSI